MPRHPAILALAISLAAILVAPMAPAQVPPEPSPPLPAVNPAQPELGVSGGRADLAQALPDLGDMPDDPAMDAEHPEGTRFLPLTLKRTYALAMIRDLRPEGFERDRSTLLDPEQLDALAKELGVDDFARFRAWFLGRKPANPGGDPPTDRKVGTQFLDVLAQLWEVESARRSTASFELAFRIYSRYAEGGASSGIAQVQLDQVDTQLQESRLELSRHSLQYRNALDRLKVDLGLPPDAPVVPQDDLLVGFREIFEAVAMAEAMPDSDPSQLTAICDRFPDFYDVRIGGSSLLGASAESGRLPNLMAAVRKSLADRDKLSGIDADRVLLRAREVVRALVEMPREYRSNRQAFLLAIRHRRHLLAEILAPPDAGATAGAAGAASSQATNTLNFIIAGSNMQVQDRIVRTWTDYQIRRIDAYRALGALPFDDWPAFLDSFKAKARPAKELDQRPEPGKAPRVPTSTPPPPPGEVEEPRP